MALIEDETRAVRLARAICADIELYNADAIANRSDLTEAVTEGAELFRSRVSPELRSVFEREMASRPFASLVRRLADAPATAAAPANPYAPQPTSAYAPRARKPMSDLNEPAERPAGSNAPLLTMVAVALVALAGVASFLLAR